MEEGHWNGQFGDCQCPSWFCMTRLVRHGATISQLAKVNDKGRGVLPLVECSHDRNDDRQQKESEAAKAEDAGMDELRRMSAFRDFIETIVLEDLDKHKS